ncbi:hypothetical protein ACJZ2D_014708 [Fusarium nematophilum]
MYQTRSSRYDQWSDWIWNADYGQYYRQRQNANGTSETQWESEVAGAQGSSHQDVPRQADVDEITQRFEDANLQGPESTAGDDPNGWAEDDYSVTGSASKSKKSKSHKTSKSKSKSKSKSSSRKAKERVQDDDEEDTEREPEHEGGYSHPQSVPGQETCRSPVIPIATQTSSLVLVDVDPTPGQMYSYPSGGGVYDPATGQYVVDGEPADDDPAVQAAIAASQAYNQGAYTAGEPSSSAYGIPDPEEPERPTTPRHSTKDHIIGTYGDAEPLDPRYRVFASHFFQPGEVFKVLWSEPGGGGGSVPSVSERQAIQDQYGGLIHVGFRRFIVVGNDQGHCTCVPIFTYGRKGCNKKGVKPDKHGIIHEVNTRAVSLSEEPRLGFAPVRVQIYEDGERISKESRVNYSKLITVEHNVKVLFIGRVTSNDFDIVADAVNVCWESKTRHRKRHHR